MKKSHLKRNRLL